MAAQLFPNRVAQVKDGISGIGIALFVFFLGLIGAVLGGAVGAQLAGAPPADPAAPPTIPPLILACSLVGQWTGWLAIPVIFSLRGQRGGPVRYYGLRMRWFDPFIGLAGLVAQIGLGMITNSFLSSEERERANSVATGLAGGSTTVAGMVVIGLFIAVLTPIAEEWLFRGVLFGGVRRLLTSPFPGRDRMWSAVAVVVGGLLFGFAHFTSWLPQGGKVALIGMLSLSAFGMILCWLYTHFRRLGPAIWAHLWFNLFGVVVVFATQRGA